MAVEPGHSEVKSQVLQTTLAEISTSRATETPDCCVICLDEVSDSSTAHPCGHANFDFLCLVSWTQLHPTCPLCKAPIREIHYGAAVSSPDSIHAGPKVYKVPPQPEPQQPAAGAASQTGPRGSIPPRDPHPTSQATFQHYFLGRHQHRRRRHSPPRPAPTPDEAILRRRHVYRHELYSLHVGSNRLSRYRELTPALFARDPQLAARARRFIRRELQVFEFLASRPPAAGEGAGDQARRRRAGNNAEFLLEYAVAILRTVDLRGSAGQAEDMLAEFLGRAPARLFLHELRAWLRSPYESLEAWDRAVQYPEPAGRGGAAKREREAAAPGPRAGGDHWRPGKRRRAAPEPAGRPGGGADRDPTGCRVPGCAGGVGCW